MLLRPRGPRSGSGYSVPSRHHLIGPIRPTRRHIAISPHGGLYAMPSLCGSAEATREWFRAFAAHSFLTCRPLRPRGVRSSYQSRTSMPTWPSPRSERLGTPDTSRNPFRAGPDFGASLVHHSLRPVSLLAPLYGSDRIAQPPGAFTSRLSTDRSPSPLRDMTTTVTGLLCWRDLHPLEWQLASLHQNRTGPIQAYGSHLGGLTAKRLSGQGWRICGWGSQSFASCVNRSQVMPSFWLRRRFEIWPRTQAQLPPLAGEFGQFLISLSGVAIFLIGGKILMSSLRYYPQKETLIWAKGNTLFMQKMSNYQSIRFATKTFLFFELNVSSESLKSASIFHLTTPASMLPDFISSSELYAVCAHGRRRGTLQRDRSRPGHHGRWC